MKKALFYLCAVFIILLPLAGLNAFDWGVVVDSRSDIDLMEDEDAEYTPRFKSSIWLNHFWADDAETQYSFAGNVFYLYNEEEYHIFDADLLRLGIKKGGLFGGGTVMDASLGRFRFSDPTGIALDHLADGARARFDIGSAAITGAAGYTGLLTKPEASVNMTLSDYIDDDDDDVYFAPKRLFEQIRAEFPSLMEGQLLSLEGLFQQDLSGDDDELNSLHLAGAVEGSLGSGFFYEVNGIFSRDISNDLSGYFGSGEVYLYMESFYNSRVSAGVLGGSEDFFTVSSPTLGLIASPAPANLTRVSADYSIRPWADRFDPFFRNLQFTAGGRAFYFDGEYTGMEAEGGVRFKPASDVGASLKGGMYLPDDGPNQGLIRLDVSVGL
ncbi:hypothetical protein [Marispirochaeta aestuarii]|uniref:hypothetical protein n=1 Tax=Marispirochaeta aestuarii TaxID=1963862 RepID=UPI0029C876B1|nr:hypothetical protein [Marispirochaeta aestuarii]